jgi:hypothetical protein
MTRAETIVKAADAAVAKLYGKVDAFTVFNLIIEAVRSAVPDAEPAEIKAALKVKRPITYQQKARNYVSRCLSDESGNSNTLGFMIPGKSPMFVSNGETIPAVTAILEAHGMKPADVTTEVLQKAAAAYLLSRMRGTPVDLHSPALAKALEKIKRGRMQ